jgi:Ser-tRNA(Ala) deacylase AlaX
MTELLCMKDFDMESCEGVVVKVTKMEDGRDDIILDQTSFYPRGGGQDWDTGTITGETAVLNVEEVRLDESGDVHHIGRFEAGLLQAGDKVSGTVDHDRRAANMRLHSAAHVIDMAVDHLGLDWVAGKGQHYPDMCAIEYTGNFDSLKADELRGAIQKQANEFVKAGSVNTLRFMSVEEMHTVVRHVPNNIPKNKPGRVVMYGDFGVPCGGTHVKDISQVGEIHIPKLKEKKGIIRLSYTVPGIN